MIVIQTLLLYDRHTDLVHTFDTSVSHMLKGLFTICAFDWFPVISLNRDGYHMWGRKCSLIPEYTADIHNGICQSWDYAYGLMTRVRLPG